MLELDVGSQASVQRCVDQVLARAGHLDVLVNNAGVMCEGFAEETTTTDAAAVFDTNFFGTVRVIHAVLPACAPGGKAGSSTSDRSPRLGGANPARPSTPPPRPPWPAMPDASFGTHAAISDYDGRRENAHHTLHQALLLAVGSADALRAPVASAAGPVRFR